MTVTLLGRQTLRLHLRRGATLIFVRDTRQRHERTRVLPRLCLHHYSDGPPVPMLQQQEGLEWNVPFQATARLAAVSEGEAEGVLLSRAALPTRISRTQVPQSCSSRRIAPSLWQGDAPTYQLVLPSGHRWKWFASREQSEIIVPHRLGH